MPRCVRNRNRRLGAHDSRLRCDSTAPEYGDFAVFDCDAVAEIGLVYVPDTDFFGIADMNRCAVNSRHGSSDRNRLNRLFGRHRTHTDNGFAVEDTCRDTVNIRQIHGYVSTLFNVSDRYIGRKKLAFKRE